MKKLFLSLVMCFVSVGSVQAADELFDFSKTERNEISALELSDICESDALGEKRVCYAYIRGVLAGYARGQLNEVAGLDHVCIPHGMSYDLIVTMLAPVFTKPSLKYLDYKEDTRAVDMVWFAMMGELFCKAQAPLAK